MSFAAEISGPVLQCQSVERRFGGIVALNGIDMQIERGEIFGLVGPNGCGKTTLINAITGFYPPQRGRILLNGRDITGLAPHYIATLGVARTFQNLALFNGMITLPIHAVSLQELGIIGCGVGYVLGGVVARTTVTVVDP